MLESRPIFEFQNLTERPLISAFPRFHLHPFASKVRLSTFFQIVKGGSGGLLNPLILLAFSVILHLEFWAVLRIFNAFGVRGFLCECEWIRV